MGTDEWDLEHERNQNVYGPEKLGLFQCKDAVCNAKMTQVRDDMLKKVGLIG